MAVSSIVATPKRPIREPEVEPQRRVWQGRVPPRRGQGPFHPLGPLEARVRREAAAAGPFRRDPHFVRRCLPMVDRYVRYFDAEVRGLSNVPEQGPCMIVGNHSGLYVMPDMWALMAAFVHERGPEVPVFILAYDLLFAVPAVGSWLRRLGAVPANEANAEAALDEGAVILVYPGGDREACRPWSQRHRVDLGQHTGFVRLALRRRVPVVPVVSQGSHETVVVVSRGERIARALGLGRLRVRVFPIVVGVPFGLAPILVPYVPLPAKVTVDVLPPLDWSADPPECADDPHAVRRRYDEVVGVMQEALDRLVAERPHPLLDRMMR